MAPKDYSNCYFQGTKMTVKEDIARRNGTYVPTIQDKAAASAKKPANKTQTAVTRATGRMLSSMMAKARVVSRSSESTTGFKLVPDPKDEALVVLPGDKHEDYYWEEDDCEVDDKIELDMEVVLDIQVHEKNKGVDQ